MSLRFGRGLARACRTQVLTLPPGLDVVGLLTCMRRLRPGHAPPAHHLVPRRAGVANSGKRLPTNAEWQEAVRGDPRRGARQRHHRLHHGQGPSRHHPLAPARARAACPTGAPMTWSATSTSGSRTGCPTRRLPRVGAGREPELLERRFDGLTGASTGRGPGAMVRGNDFGGHVGSPFTVYGLTRPSTENSVVVGFRGAR